MNAVNTMNADETVEAIAKGLDIVMDTQEPAPKKTAKKASKVVEPKITVSNSEKVVKAANKAAIVQFKASSGETYDLNAAADPKALKAAAAVASKALTAIGNKDADLLKHYMALGQFQSEAVKLFKSVKLYGMFLAKELPASQDLDSALRSNCKWLYEALNVEGAEGSDLLVVLGVNQLEDYKSKNPTVIKRDYKNAKKDAELAAMAEEAGKTVEELEDEANAIAEAEAEKAKEKMQGLIAEFVKAALAKANKAEAEADFLDVLNEAFLGKKADAIELMNSLA
jgi:hypothetical protein